MKIFHLSVVFARVLLCNRNPVFSGAIHIEALKTWLQITQTLNSTMFTPFFLSSPQSPTSQSSKMLQAYLLPHVHKYVVITAVKPSMLRTTMFLLYNGFLSR